MVFHTVISIIRSETCRLLPQPLHLNPHRFELSVARGATIPNGETFVGKFDIEWNGLATL